MMPFDWPLWLSALITFALVLAGWFGLMKALYKIAGR